MSDKKYTHNIVEYATFGLEENVEPNATVEVNQKDLVFVALTLQELIQFFHNPDHYSNPKAINRYLGSADEPGAYSLLSKANYEVMSRMLPDSVQEQFSQGAFDSPESPFYFEPDK